MEGLAEAGGICISSTAFDQVKKKLSLGYEYLGEHSVKNIDEPVRVYRVLMEPEDTGKLISEKMPVLRRWDRVALGAVAVSLIVGMAVAVWNFYLRPISPPTEVASEERITLSLPGRPSIAVLPFVNMSDNPGLDYFSDGITEDIITDLSQFQNLSVVARHSVFTYKGKPVDVRQVSEALGVRYVLEGSVRISEEEDQVRITAQLVDATTGKHLWAERYDRPLKEFFALQDEITDKIVLAMDVKLLEGEQMYGRRQSTKSVEAYKLFRRANELFEQWSPEANAKGIQMSKQAIDLDPAFAMAWANLGWCYWAKGVFGWSNVPQRSVEEAHEAVNKALAIDEGQVEARMLLGDLLRLQGEFEQGIAEAQRAVIIDPNNADAVGVLGKVLVAGGRYEEGIAMMKKAMRLAPRPATWMFRVIGQGYLMSGRYEEAIAAFQKSIGMTPNYLMPHVWLAATYSELGRVEEAQAEVSEILRINPNFSLQGLPLEYTACKDPPDRFFDGLRKAGLK
jgi:adenylate cyclase